MPNAPGPIPLPSRKINRRWLYGWRSCATHTRLDAAAQQTQADKERAIKKCPQVELGADKSVTLTRLSTRSVGAGRHSR
jgi:hypothetical protein